MTWALLAVATLATCEILLRLPILHHIQRAAQVAIKASRLIANPAISDHWKERVLPQYAGRLALASLNTFGLLLIACLAFALLVGADALFGLDVLHRILSLAGFVWISAV